MKIWRALGILAVFSLVSVSTLLGAGRSFAAESPTSTPTTVLSTDTPVATAIPATPAPEPTLLPTVTQEQTTPVATTESLPTVSASPAVPQPSTPLPENTPTPTPLPAPVSTTVAPPVINWPTPSQLKENARLRWGRGIPASVRRWAFLIVPAARRYQLDPNLVAAVMTMESNGDPLALSPAGARGLMQILDGPWDPATNVDTGARMLSSLYAEFGDWRLVLAGYNAGPGAVTAYGGIPPYRETRDYVIVVTYLWDLFSHRHLTFARRSQYRATLGDLERFSDQRKKVDKLAKIAHVAPPATALCPPRACGRLGTGSSSPPLDPFWPVGGMPDPLQHVAPPALK